jgi:hypothetical protein
VTALHRLPSHLELSEPLPEAECRALLSTRDFGRAGLTSGGLPVIVPVRYESSVAGIAFRTGARSELQAVATGDVLAFEVDTYDPGTGAGWSVLVLGRATISTPGAGTGSAPDHGVELGCELISGRRFVLEPIVAAPADRVRQ